MCRITGYYDTNASRNYDPHATIAGMRDCMRHGGPDDAGVFVDNEAGIGLGHRRLSIIDLSAAGHQPMRFENLTMVYNGEVYNYPEIRKELETCGYAFTSTSDTEVVLKAFHKWGHECIKKFRGMWGLALWDSKDKKLHLCRDRFGVKPLYWSWNNNVFLFGSELKSLVHHPCFEKKLCDAGLGLYLQYGYIPSPYTIYEKTFKLEPGSWLVFDGKGPRKWKYWDHRDCFADKKATAELAAMDEKQVLDELEKVLVESFKLRMVADVPVGMFLSGGVDSSLLTALLQKDSSRPLKTFTIGFNETAFNEANFAAEVSKILGTDHTDYYCTSKEAYSVIQKYPDLYDEPFADPSGIPTYLVSKLASEQVKVSLSADGADEQFGGYVSYEMAEERFKGMHDSPFLPLYRAATGLLSRHMESPWFTRFSPFGAQQMRFKDKIAKLHAVLKCRSTLERHEAMEKHFSNDAVASALLGRHDRPDRLGLYPVNYFDGFDPLSQMLIDDLTIYLSDDMLAKVDRASMAVSIESREPFLDSKLVSFSSTLPVNYKIRHKTRKYALRQLLSKYVPERIFNRPKLGFEIPLYDWFSSDLNTLFDIYLDPVKIAKEWTFSPQAVKGIRAAAKCGSKAATHKLWILLMFQMWRERWME